MADLTITIPAPILITGQYFKERHRQLPSGSWSGYTNRSNAPFTITGLAVGKYEFEFILVNADSTECAAVYRIYDVVADFECISFASVMKEVNKLYHIEVTYTLPPGYTDPACGWEVEYIQKGKSNKFTMSNLPTTGIMKIPCANEGTVLYIRALLCNGKVKQCHSNDIVPISDPPCQGITNVSKYITHKQVGNTCEYYLHIDFTQSVPATTQPKLHYVQWHYGIAQGDRFNGTLNILPTATSVVVKLNPLFFSGDECTKYYVTFIDACNNGIVEEVSFCRTLCFDETP